MKKTILYLHETAKISGGEESLFNLITGLDRDSFTPIFACPEDGPLPEKLRSRGIEVIPMQFPRIRSMAGVGGAMKKLKSVIKEKGADLIHSNSIRTHIYGAVAGKLSGVPVVWHERNLVTTELADPDRIFSFLADRIICNSNAIARRFLARGRMPGKVATIHNGVDLKRFSPSIEGFRLRQQLGIGPDEIVIGIASRFHKDKGHEAFFQAARSVLSVAKDKKIKARFLVAGGAVFEEDKARESYLRKYAAELGIERDVIFTGFASDMPAMYAAMDIFVLASFDEPCGRVLFEAMASGKPVIGTDSGGTPEIVSDGVTGILVPPRDRDAMARDMLELALDKEKRLSMGAAGRKRVEDFFDIREHVKKTERLYEELLSHGR